MTATILYLILGFILLILGANWLVKGASSLARKLNISELIIGVTIVSAGTSLPELVTSLVAAFRKKSDIAIGNIIGSNIFNILLILGVSSVIRPVLYNLTTRLISIFGYLLPLLHCSLFLCLVVKNTN